MSNVLAPERPDTQADLEAIKRALFEEDEHLWCWCKDDLTLCGMYKEADEESIEDEDYEPSCVDCKDIVRCFYCGCEVGNVTCNICIPRLEEWFGKSS